MRFDNHVADIDAHTEKDAPVFCVVTGKFVDAVLELQRGSNRFDSTRKFRQEPIASVLHDAPAVLRDCRIDGVRQECGQTCVRRLFVVMHETRIAGHVGGQYRRQPAFDPSRALLYHRKQIPSRIYSYDKICCGATSGRCGR